MGFFMKHVGLVPASFIVSFVIVTYGEYKKIISTASYQLLTKRV